MTRAPGAGMRVIVDAQFDDQQSVSLCLSGDGGARLTVGGYIEVVLGRAQVASLVEQSGPVLADLVAMDAVDDELGAASVVGERAEGVARYARSQAEVARAAGRPAEAAAAVAAARAAEQASDKVAEAVRGTLVLVREAEDALGVAGAQAAVARACRLPAGSPVTGGAPDPG